MLLLLYCLNAWTTWKKKKKHAAHCGQVWNPARTPEHRPVNLRVLNCWRSTIPRPSPCRRLFLAHHLLNFSVNSPTQTHSHPPSQKKTSHPCTTGSYNGNIKQGKWFFPPQCRITTLKADFGLFGLNFILMPCSTGHTAPGFYFFLPRVSTCEYLGIDFSSRRTQPTSVTLMILSVLRLWCDQQKPWPLLLSSLCVLVFEKWNWNF